MTRLDGIKPVQMSTPNGPSIEVLIQLPAAVATAAAARLCPGGYGAVALVLMARWRRRRSAPGRRAPLLPLLAAWPAVTSHRSQPKISQCNVTLLMDLAHIYMHAHVQAMHTVSLRTFLAEVYAYCVVFMEAVS